MADETSVSDLSGDASAPSLGECETCDAYSVSECCKSCVIEASLSHVCSLVRD